MNVSLRKKSILSLLFISLFMSLQLAVSDAATVDFQSNMESTTIVSSADGRGYGFASSGFGPASFATLNYYAPYMTYVVDHNHGYVSENREEPAPEESIVWDPSGTHTYNPSSFYQGPFAESATLPKFLLTDNLTSTITDVEYNLEINWNVTMHFDYESEILLVGGLVYQAAVSVADTIELFAFTGEASGTTYYMVVDPEFNVISYSTVEGYFAIPVLCRMAGNYSIYLRSNIDVSLTLTPSPLAPQFVERGESISGEISIASMEVDPEGGLIAVEQPPEIVVIASTVSDGDEISFFKSINQIGFGPYYVFAYSTGEFSTGLPYGSDITNLATSYKQKIPENGTAYIILIAYTGAQVKYTFRIDDTSFDQATVGEAFRVNTLLSAPQYVYRTFMLTESSIYRFNYTIIEDGGQSFALYRIHDGVVYEETGMFRTGNAPNNYQYTYHLPAGEYVLEVYASGPSATLLQINAYPLVNIGTELSTNLGGVYAFSLDSSRFEWKTFNLTLTFEANVSVQVRMAIFSPSNELVAEGEVYIANKEEDGVFQGQDGLFWTDDGIRNFDGNESLLNTDWAYMHNEIGLYWVIFEVLSAYNTTSAGIQPNRWTTLTSVTCSFELALADQPLGQVVEATIDSSTGQGSTTINVIASGSSLFSVQLRLTPKSNVWTQIRITMINGTIFELPVIFDNYRYWTNGFDQLGSLGLTHPDEVYTNIYGFDNMTHYMEFGVYDSEMLIFFIYDLQSSDGGELQIEVNHRSTAILQGMQPSPAIGPAPSAPLPMEVLLTLGLSAVGVGVAAAVIIVLRRRRRT